jgi:hypothetical protein
MKKVRKFSLIWWVEFDAELIGWLGFVLVIIFVLGYSVK